MSSGLYRFDFFGVCHSAYYSLQTHVTRSSPTAYHISCGHMVWMVWMMWMAWIAWAKVTDGDVGATHTGRCLFCVSFTLACREWWFTVSFSFALLCRLDCCACGTLYFAGLWDGRWAVWTFAIIVIFYCSVLLLYFLIAHFYFRGLFRACRPTTAYLVEPHANITDTRGSRMLEGGAVSCSWLVAVVASVDISVPTAVVGVPFPGILII